MFLKTYEHRDIYFPASGETLSVTLFPTGEYAVTGENDEGVYKGFGDTVLAAIADYVATREDEDAK